MGDPTELAERERELPRPSPELIVLGVAMRAYVRRLPRKERMAFLEEVTTTLDLLAAGQNVRRIRGTKDEAAIIRASIQAAAWWASALRVIVSGVE